MAQKDNMKPSKHIFDFGKATVCNTFYDIMTNCVYIELDGIDSYMLAIRSNINDELVQNGIIVSSTEELKAKNIEVKGQIVYLPATDEIYFVAFTDNDYNESTHYDVSLNAEEIKLLKKLFRSDDVSRALHSSIAEKEG